MIIEQIKLSNWLSYPDKWHIDGKTYMPSLSFDKEPVYLIYGKNGAGKSSIVDAILFALFGDYSRALTRQDIKNTSAIRSGEKNASVELTFSLNSQRHKVWRSLSDGNPSSARYYTWASIKNDWQQEMSQVREVDKKVEALLGMHRDLFLGTVILEQGKTDQFMQFKPNQQTEYIKKLLGLDIYTKYYDEANKLANEYKKKAKEKQEDIKTLGDVSTETISQMIIHQKEVQNLLATLEQEIELSANLCREAREVQKRRVKVAQLASQTSEYEQQINQRDEIRQAVKICAEWTQIEPIVREVTRALRQHQSNHTQFDSLQSELAQHKNELVVCQDIILTLMPRWGSAKQALQMQKKNLLDLHTQQPEAQKHLDALSNELKLDSRELDLQTQQQQRQEQLRQFVKVESDFHLCIEIEKIGKQLKLVVTRLNESNATLQSTIEVEQQLKDKSADLEAYRKELQQILEQVTILRGSLSESQSSERQFRSNVDTNRGVLARREDALGKSKCPTCGASLEGTEYVRFHAEFLELRQIVNDEENQLKRSEQKTRELDQKLKALEQKYRSQENHITSEEASIKSGNQANQQKRYSAQQSQQSSFAEWETLRGELQLTSAIFTSPTEEILNLARERHKSVSYAIEEFKRLDQIHRVFESDKNRLRDIESLRKFPAGTFNQEQLQHAQTRFNNLQNSVQQQEKSLADLEKSERKLSEDVIAEETKQQNLTKQIEKIETQSLPDAENTRIQSNGHLQESQGRLENLLAQCIWLLQQKASVQQAADGDILAHDQLKNWVAQYGPLAAKLEQLEAAEQKIQELQNTLRSIESEIAQYSEDARQDQVEDLERRLQAKRDEKRLQDNDNQALLKKIGQEEDRLRRKEELQRQYESLIDEESNFRELANLLVPPKGGSSGGPLLRHIIQDSLQKVAIVASDILEEWEQSTEVVVPDDTLEFKIIDRSSNKNERHFQNFSGGEKFMIALAMALAIGEVASSTGHMDCLFIDEGFGSLDTENRALVAQKIVGELVKTGRRKQVIVITHMTDLQSAFITPKSRYYLVNDGNSTRLMMEKDNANAYAQ